MSVFGKDFLERVKSRRVPSEPQQSVSQSENDENGAEQIDSVEEPARARGHTGPPNCTARAVVRPARRASWRDDTNWLEQNFSEQFGAVTFEERSDRILRNTERSSAQPCSANANSEPAGFCDRQPQSPPIIPESPQSLPAALPVPPPIPALPLLQSDFWQALLFGSRESIVSAADANIAVRLVACQLGANLETASAVEERRHSDVSEFTDSIRVHTLRKRLDEHFGGAAWPAMNELWRSAPSTPGAPAPGLDQSQLPPGPWDSRNQPRWIESLHDSSRIEREWLEDLGIGHP
jgi:hypothetical protein